MKNNQCFILPENNGHIFFHAFRGPDCVYWPTASSIINNGIPANVKQIMNGIKKAPEKQFKF